MKLVLFDIDGTLLKNIHPEGRPNEMKILIEKHFGISIDPKAVYVSGMTDKGALMTRLTHAGIKNPEKDKRLFEALDGFEQVTKETIAVYPPQKISGVDALLKRLQKEKMILGVLTGNTPKRAQLKLEAVGLWHYFPVGAFGHTTHIRSELVDMAIKDAQEKTGITFAKKDVFIIGDTIRDIQCAKDGGVKSIAVATGKESVEILQKEKPDFIFKDFKDMKALVQAIQSK